MSPALDGYATTTLNDLWKRATLSPRDRSLITVAALIARQQTVEMAAYMDRALDNGVKPAELSETITHLAFYAGWGNAMATVAVAKDVFARRGIGANQLPSASPSFLALDETAEAARVAQVDSLIGATSPGLAQYTTEALFRNLWLRPDLTPRDRSLVTVSALIATGQVAQMPYHLNRAMSHGLTQEQAGEVIAHLRSTRAGRTPSPPRPRRRTCSPLATNRASRERPRVFELERVRRTLAEVSTP